MKLRYFYMLFVLLLGAIISLGTSTGRAGMAGWGNTGAPGDQEQGGVPRTCISCHGTSADVQVEISLNLMDADENPVTAMYAPGETYSLTIALNASMGNPQAYGFQLLCLNAEQDVSGPESSNYSNPSANASIALASNTGRTYVEHPSPSGTPEFSVDWTAPEMGSGAVTFYLCGNGVNLNMSTSGDNADCLKLQLDEDLAASTSQITGIRKVQVNPNPNPGYFSLLVENDRFENGIVSIRDLNGRLIYTSALSLTTNEDVTSISLDTPPGLYLLQITTNRGVHTEKFMVQ
ncbi:MAG: T9SS type A sorting domain-containing protein [Saprospiraceae bacterium]|nr:T9SS type A sorting domain-containing protein [Saprospiraceae bacterium]